jgi:hypothetical protein
MKSALYVAGAVFEFGGLVFAILPDLVPGARRFSRWLDPRWRRLENRVRRLLHLPSRPHVIVVGAGAIALAVGGHVRAEVSIDPAADIERRVEFLLRRDQEHQRALGLLGERLENIEHESEKRLQALREGMETHVTEALAATGASYRAVRILGALALFVGLGLSTAGNLVS